MTIEIIDDLEDKINKLISMLSDKKNEIEDKTLRVLELEEENTQLKTELHDLRLYSTANQEKLDIASDKIKSLIQKIEKLD